MSDSKLQIVLFLFVIQASFPGCKEHKKQNYTPNTTQTTTAISIPSSDTIIQKGVIHPLIHCPDSTGYALYLPSGYTTEKRYPVIFFFDAHGEGLLPVEKYKSLAEKYSFIIAGSNTSKNGLPLKIIKNISDGFIKNVEQRFSVDPHRIYVGGFSGGARVASRVALENPKIAGLIGCGAGFADQPASFGGKFCYVALAGNADFNLVELKNLDRTLETSSFYHRLVVFDGKHEWPPVNTMEEAWQLLEINAMKNGTMEKNDSLITNFTLLQQQTINKLKGKNQLVETWNLCRNLTTLLYGLAETENYKKEVIAIENSPGLMAAMNSEIDAEKEEIKMQQQLTNAFNLKQFEFIQNEINRLKKQKSLVNQRMLGFLGLVSYMYVNNTMNNGEFAGATSLSPPLSVQLTELIKIYLLLEPGNPEAHYLHARLLAKLNQAQKAKNELKKAIELGFKDHARIEKDGLLSQDK